MITDCFQQRTINCKNSACSPGAREPARSAKIAAGRLVLAELAAQNWRQFRRFYRNKTKRLYLNSASVSRDERDSLLAEQRRRLGLARMTTRVLKFK